MVALIEIKVIVAHYSFSMFVTNVIFQPSQRDKFIMRDHKKTRTESIDLIYWLDFLIPIKNKGAYPLFSFLSHFYHKDFYGTSQ